MLGNHPRPAVSRALCERTCNSSRAGTVFPSTSGPLSPHPVYFTINRTSVLDDVRPFYSELFNAKATENCERFVARERRRTESSLLDRKSIPNAIVSRQFLSKSKLLKRDASLSSAHYRHPLIRKSGYDDYPTARHGVLIRLTARES